MSKKELKNKLLSYLASNKLMTLGTCVKNKPWGATVFFAYDKNFTILFYSRKSTRHCKNIAKNPLVSVVINQDWGGTYGIKGAQILGMAAEVSKKDYRQYYRIYKRRYSWADEFTDHTLYFIHPIEVWYIDQKLFGHFFRVKVK